MKKIKILFACVENSFRSQIAEAIVRKYFSDYIIPYSAGSRPIYHLHENTIKILNEMGLNPAEYHSKGFNELNENEFDFLITMGCDEVCPFYPSKKQLEWELPDIKNESMEKIRILRDRIKNKIEKEIIRSFYEG